jgi:hypothetical protein
MRDGGGCIDYHEEEYKLPDGIINCFRKHDYWYNGDPKPPRGSRRVNAWPWEGKVGDRPIKK